MDIRTVILLAASFVIAALPVHAEEAQLTGRTLFDWCTASPDSEDMGHCGIYVGGFVNGAMAAQGDDRTGLICLPSHFTAEEAKAIFIRSAQTALEKVPKMLDQQVDAVLGAFLGAEFPCRKRK